MLRRPIHVVLRDGTRVLLRPIQPDDKERLQRGLSMLSPLSRYQRFHAHVDHLSDRQLAYLTEVDQHDHVAWVALDEDAPDVPGVGVARCVRLPDEPTVAEAAITVADAYHGRGVGTLLLGVLGRAARDVGIETFRNYVLADNEAMLTLLEDLGATHVVTEDSSTVAVDLPIPTDPDALPDTPAGRTLRAAAAGQVRLLLTPLAPLRLPVVDAERERRSGDGERDPAFRSWLDGSVGR